MATHSSTLAWKIPWTEEPGRLQSMGSLGVRHDWATSLSLFAFMHWRRKWQPTPVFLPGEFQGWGVWWAAVYGVAQSRTQPKRLSSSGTLIHIYIYMNLLLLIYVYCTARYSTKALILSTQINHNLFTNHALYASHSCVNVQLWITSSFLASRPFCTNQITFACKDRGVHSSKVLLFSMP